MKALTRYGLGLLAFSVVLCISTPLIAKDTNVIIRAAIDIGSGGPKLRVAEVDLAVNKIIKILHIQQYPVIFQESLSKGRILNAEIMLQGIQAIKDAISVAESFKAEGVVMIGASIFRNALNGEQFALDIRSEVGLPVHIVDQDLEGKLAFQAVLAKTSINRENLVVWDIGGGSTQFVGVDDGSYLIDGSNEGSGSFRDFIIESIQCRDVKECRTPNPISQEQANLARAHAADLAMKVDQIFRDKLRRQKAEVVGVGSVFGRGITALMPGKNPFTIEDLVVAVHNLVGKSDIDLGGGDFACIEVSNALLALGFMEGLDIKQMNIIDVNNADGALVYKSFWE
jgi:exopolyphosphatase / guanosine-5'-triphosphate,3'-diphosphate pyrophosphatase